MKRFLFVVVLLAALIPVPAQAHSVPVCNYVGSGTFDPIVAPGQEPFGHEHDFFANRRLLQAGYRANATYSSLLGADTSCNTLLNGVEVQSSVYWVPSVWLDGNPATPLRPNKVNTYYVPDELTRPFEVFPPDLRMVAGNPHATSPQPLSRVYWSCAQATPKQATPPTCAGTGGSLTAHVHFPQCWDGQLNSHTGPGNTADFSGDPTAVVNHLAYALASGSCPAGFSHKLPALHLRIGWPYTGDGSRVVLSSGSVYSLHADFWNTWDQAALTRMVDVCLNAGTAHAHGDNQLCRG